MKKNDRKSKKQIYFSIILLALISLSCVSVAWLSMNRNSDSEKMKMQLNANGLKIDHYNVYQYEYESGKVKNIYDSKEEYNMTAYDSIFEERNSNTLLIFEVFLYHFQPDCKEITVYVDRKDNDISWNDKNNHLTSNVIYIKAATGGTLEIDSAADIETVFYGARDAFANISTRNQFINIKETIDNNMAKYTLLSETDRITLPITLSASEISKVAGPDGSEQRIPVYFVFDYNDLLVRAQDIVHFSEISIIENLTVDYQNDITSILFEE